MQRTIGPTRGAYIMSERRYPADMLVDGWLTPMDWANKAIFHMQLSPLTHDWPSRWHEV